MHVAPSFIAPILAALFVGAFLVLCGVACGIAGWRTLLGRVGLIFSGVITTSAVMTLLVTP